MLFAFLIILSVILQNLKRLPHNHPDYFRLGSNPLTKSVKFKVQPLNRKASQCLCLHLRGLKTKLMGMFKIRPTAKIILAVIPSFLTEPFQRYSTLNTTSGPLIESNVIIFIGYLDFNNLSVVSDDIPIPT